MTRKVCVVTGSRADYGLLSPVMHNINQSEKLELQLIVTTMHLSGVFGNTYSEIEKDGFHIDEKIENLLDADKPSAKVKSSALAQILLSDTFSRLQPDIVLLLGDRFEAHAAATCALLMNIPIAHIHGGEKTLGAIDEQLRHSITKMSNIHFTSTSEYRERVIQMGESPESVFCVGAPGLDNILNIKLLEKKELEKAIQWKIKPKTALFTYHPETVYQTGADDIDMILEQLDESDLNVLFTYSNADSGGQKINNAINQAVSRKPEKFHVIDNLGQLRYLSVMNYVDVIIGNSSSGIIEAASFKKPVINIGKRQSGRLQSGNIINCSALSLSNAIKESQSKHFKQKCHRVKNIYGDGRSSQKIVHYLETLPFESNKRFYDL